MQKLLAAALIAAVTVPVAVPANAHAAGQSYRDDRRDDRRDRDRYQDRRHHDRRDHARDRDRRWGHNDWRAYRDHNRAIFNRGQWRAPFRYNSFRVGARIAPTYYSSRYVINDPWRYRLPPVGYNQRWVRHYDDMLLVDTRRGTVIRVIRNFYR